MLYETLHIYVCGSDIASDYWAHNTSLAPFLLVPRQEIEQSCMLGISILFVLNCSGGMLFVLFIFGFWLGFFSCFCFVMFCFVFVCLFVCLFVFFCFSFYLCLVADQCHNTILSSHFAETTASRIHIVRAI